MVTGELITQLYDPTNYFAMHFQKVTSIDNILPSIPILLSPTSGTTLTTGNVSLLRSGAIDTGAGISGYIYQVSTGVSFTTFTTSGSTTATGITLNGLNSATYYRRVYAIDNAGNTG